MMHVTVTLLAACLMTLGTSWPTDGRATMAFAQTARGQAGDRQAEFGRYPDREFVRRKLDTLTWTATEGNTLGVQTAIIEGDPTKPGFYLIANKFPPGVMSRPHTHPDER